MLKTKSATDIFRFESKKVAALVFIALGLFSIGMPLSTQNFSTESVQSGLIDIPVISDLKISNVGFTSLTLNWTVEKNNAADASTYRIYQGNDLLATVPENNYMYKVTGLKANSWYQFSIKACISSGECNNGPLVGVNTLRVEEATESVINEVNNLVSTGLLNQNQGNDLIQELASIYQLNPENTGAVISHLRSFIDNLNSLINTGVLSREVGQPMVDTINEVIKNIPKAS